MSHYRAIAGRQFTTNPYARQSEWLDAGIARFRLHRRCLRLHGPDRGHGLSRPSLCVRSLTICAVTRSAPRGRSGVSGAGDRSAAPMSWGLGAPGTPSPSSAPAANPPRRLDLAISICASASPPQTRAWPPRDGSLIASHTAARTIPTCPCTSRSHLPWRPMIRPRPIACGMRLSATVARRGLVAGARTSGIVLADHAASADAGDQRSGSRGGQARVCGDDADAQDRYREDRGGAAGLRPEPSWGSAFPGAPSPSSDSAARPTSPAADAGTARYRRAPRGCADRRTRAHSDGRRRPHVRSGRGRGHRRSNRRGRCRRPTIRIVARAVRGKGCLPGNRAVMVTTLAHSTRCSRPLQAHARRA